MPYNLDAFIHEKQVVINNTQTAGATSGGLVVQGGISSIDAYVTGHVAVNNVNITPNLNDIVYEQQSVLDPETNTWTDIPEFYFTNAVANTFKANINVTVSSGIPKYALYEIYGVYKNSGWVITSNFTGDMTGVTFNITNSFGVGQIQYQNTNFSGTTTTIRYRAQTTAPPGTSPIGSTGVINNTSGPFIANSMLYANTTSTIAAADITYNSNVLKVGGPTRMVIDNVSTYTSVSNGGSFTAMGDASIGKSLMVGEKIGVAKTNPAFSVDVSGDINFTGTLYKNGSVYSGSSIWDTNGTKVFYTAGNLGLGTNDPTVKLDVVGDIKASGKVSAGSIETGSGYVGSLWATSSTLTDTSITRMTAGGAVIADLVSTNISSGALNVTSIVSDHLTGISGTIGSIKATNASIGSITASNVILTNEVATNISTGTLHASGGITAGSIKATSIESSSINITGITAANALISGVESVNVNATNITATNALISGVNSTNIHATNVTASSALITGINSSNINVTNISASSFVFGSGVVSTAITAANFHGSYVHATVSATAENLVGSAATIGSIVVTNGVASNISAGGLAVTNAVAGTISAGVLQASTGITSASAKITTLDSTNATVTNFSAGSFALGYGNATGISAGNFHGQYIHGTASVTAENLISTAATMASVIMTKATVTNASLTNVSAGTIIASTGITAGSGSISTLSSTNATITNLNATNITIGNIQDLTIGGNLTVSGTTTTVNVETITIEDNLLVVNSGPAGSADGGILVKRYTTGTSGPVNYAGIFYKESSDEITLAATASDPGATTVTIDNYLAMRAHSIALENTADASSLGNGGSLTVLGGAAISKSLIVGSGISAASANLTSASGTNASFTNITASSFRTTDSISTNISTASLNSNGITTGNIRLNDNALFFRTANDANNSIAYNSTIDGPRMTGYGGGFLSCGTAGSIVALTWASTGNIGIGTTAPSYKLHVAGDIYSTQDITAFSDRRKKTDIVTIGQALDKVEQLRGVYFTSLINDRKGTGVVAQEIEEILPEVVLTAEDGFKSVAYGNVVGVLIEAIKELSAKVKQNECKCQCQCANC